MLPVEGSNGSFKAQSEELGVGEVFALGEGKSTKSELSDSAPVWLRTSAENSIDQRASRSLLQAIEKSTESDVRATLIELVSSKLQETATLATRALLLLEDDQGLVGEKSILSRKGMFAHTSNWIERLPCHFADASHCERFAKSIRSGNEARADTLLRLLIPFTNEQLEAGGDKMLIEELSSGQLDEKTLAILQLSAITGKTLGYHPERPSNDSIVQWRKILSKGEIRHARAQ
jgi:hypothetical protein